MKKAFLTFLIFTYCMQARTRITAQNTASPLKDTFIAELIRTKKKDNRPLTREEIKRKLQKYREEGLKNPPPAAIVQVEQAEEKAETQQKVFEEKQEIEQTLTEDNKFLKNRCQKS